METVTIDRIDHASPTAIEKYAAGVSRVVNTIVAEGDNMALPGRMSPEQVRALVEQAGERGGIFFAEERDHVIAFAQLRPEDDDQQTARLGVWVLPEHRRRGLGIALTRAAIEYARDLGYTKLHGIIPDQNQPALSFFSAVGPLAALEGGGMRYELPV